ncbi:MAG: hypothetical protein WKF84_07135 [Pyrinomonadaceae bacterium]
MSMKLYVGNLAFQTSSDDLQQLFAQAGTKSSRAAAVERPRDGSITRLRLRRNDRPRRRRYDAAIEQFNGKDFNGRNLTVNEARPREDRGRSGGGGGGGGGRGGWR